MFPITVALSALLGMLARYQYRCRSGLPHCWCRQCVTATVQSSVQSGSTRHDTNMGREQCAADDTRASGASENPTCLWPPPLVAESCLFSHRQPELTAQTSANPGVEPVEERLLSSSAGSPDDLVRPCAPHGRPLEGGRGVWVAGRRVTSAQGHGDSTGPGELQWWRGSSLGLSETRDGSQLS